MDFQNYPCTLETIADESIVQAEKGKPGVINYFVVRLQRAHGTKDPRFRQLDPWELIYFGCRPTASRSTNKPYICEALPLRLARYLVKCSMNSRYLSLKPVTYISNACQLILAAGLGHI